MPTTAASYDGMPRRLQKSCAQRTDGTRRRVHSPSWATSSRVTDETVVWGSRKPSTPRRAADHSRTCFSSSESDTRVCPVLLRRKRSNMPMGTSVTDGRQHDVTNTAHGPTGAPPDAVVECFRVVQG